MRCLNLALHSKALQSRLIVQPTEKRQVLTKHKRQASQRTETHCHRLQVSAGATESSQQTPASAQDLKAQLQDAIRSEAYSRAAEIRDALKLLESSDPTLLKEQLEDCIAQERYEVWLLQQLDTLAFVCRASKCEWYVLRL